MIGCLRRNLNISSTTVKEQAYKSLVRPSLEYDYSVWDPYNKGEMGQLEKVQRRDARFIINRQQNTSSVGDVLHNLNLLS